LLINKSFFVLAAVSVVDVNCNRLVFILCCMQFLMLTVVRHSQLVVHEHWLRWHYCISLSILSSCAFARWSKMVKTLPALRTICAHHPNAFGVII
jgi:hypothetical protein